MWSSDLSLPTGKRGLKLPEEYHSLQDMLSLPTGKRGLKFNG